MGALTERLRAERPLVHAGEAYLGLAWPGLRWLEDHVQPGMSTLETGSGASTIVFAAGGASHVAISPSAEEHRRILAYCRDHAIATDRLELIAQSSDLALRSTWRQRPLDLVLFDGAHSFPFPVLDWAYVAPHLRTGGHVLVDDAYQPAVNVLVRYLRRHPAWKLEGVLGHRTPCFRKVADIGLAGEWDDETLGRPRFDYLPPARRAVAWLRYRALEQGPVAAAVAPHATKLGRRLAPALERVAR